MLRNTTTVFFSIFLLILPNVTTARGDARDSVVKVHKSQEIPDYYHPWRTRNTSVGSASGVIVTLPGQEVRYVLTNAHAVKFATQVYVQPNQSTEKFRASVMASAPGIDLALLKLEEPEELEPFTPLDLADELPNVKDVVYAYGFPVGGDELSVTKGIVSRIEEGGYYFDTRGIRIQIDAALNPGNSGGPAVSNDLIVGLVFSGMRKSDRIGYVIPAEEIRRFLIDVRDGKYEGRPCLFDRFQPAQHESLRDRLGLEPEQSGVVVTRPYRDTGSYPLKRWDIVTHIGDYEIDDSGMVQIREDLRLPFTCLVPECAEGQSVPLRILRTGKPQEIQVPIEFERERVIPLSKYELPEYVIFGPLVFTTPYYEMVLSLCKNESGLSTLASMMNPLLSRLGDRPSFPGEQLVLVPCRFFPHPITKGYEDLRMGVLTHLNDQPVKNLSHFVELVRDSSDEFLEFTFAGIEDTLVFQREELLSSTQSILESQGIRYQFSSRLAEIWDAD